MLSLEHIPCDLETKINILETGSFSKLAVTAPLRSALPLDNQPLHVSLASLREAHSTWMFIDLKKKERERTQAGFGPNYFLKEKQYKQDITVFQCLSE